MITGGNTIEGILTTAKIFSPGNTLEVHFSEEVGMVKIFTVTVVALKEEGLFVAAKESELTSQLKPGMEISIAYVRGDGQKYMFGTYQIAYLLHESSLLILAKPWKVDFSLLRRHFRFKVEMPLYYLLNGVVHVGQIKDISACGVSAIVGSDPQMVVGAQIALEIKFPNCDPFCMKGEIIRAENLEEGKVAIALNFLQVSEEMRREISKCLLENVYQPTGK